MSGASMPMVGLSGIDWFATWLLIFHCLLGSGCTGAGRVVSTVTSGRAPVTWAPMKIGVRAKHNPRAAILNRMDVVISDSLLSSVSKSKLRERLAEIESAQAHVA